MMLTRVANRIPLVICGAGFIGGRKDVLRAEASAAAPPPVSSPCLISNKSGLQDFNQQMNYRQAALFLKNSPHHIHEAARKDCEERNCSLESYLKVSRRAAFSFITTKDRIWDRESLKEKLAGLLSGSRGKGKFVFFSGGKSFGKTLLLNSLNLPAGSNGVILRLDGRGTGSDFHNALSNGVEKSLGRTVADVLFSGVKAVWEANVPPQHAEAAEKLHDLYCKTFIEIFIEPPTAVSLVSPADNTISPPAPVSPDPTAIVMSPPLPPLALPVAMLIEPLSPEAESPVCKLTAPVVSPTTEDTVTVPLPLAPEPEPLATRRSPPTPLEDDPLVICSSPPGLLFVASLGRVPLLRELAALVSFQSNLLQQMQRSLLWSRRSRS